MFALLIHKCVCESFHIRDSHARWAFALLTNHRHSSSRFYRFQVEHKKEMLHKYKVIFHSFPSWASSNVVVCRWHTVWLWRRERKHKNIKSVSWIFLPQLAARLSGAVETQQPTSERCKLSSLIPSSSVCWHGAVCHGTGERDDSKGRKERVWLWWKSEICFEGKRSWRRRGAAGRRKWISARKIVICDAVCECDDESGHG